LLADDDPDGIRAVGSRAAQTGAADRGRAEGPRVAGGSGLGADASRGEREGGRDGGGQGSDTRHVGEVRIEWSLDSAMPRIQHEINVKNLLMPRPGQLVPRRHRVAP